RAKESGADIDAELSEQPCADESADDTYEDVADEAEAVTLDDETGEPAGDRADQNENQQSFDGHGGCCLAYEGLSRAGRRSRRFQKPGGAGLQAAPQGVRYR